MTAQTPGSPTGAPRDDAQPTDGDGVDAGRRAEGDPGSWAARYARSFDISQGLASVDPEYAEWIDPVASVTLAARTIRELTAERDRARATAVMLEQELDRAQAMVRSLGGWRIGAIPRTSAAIHWSTKPGLLPRDGAE